MKVCIDICEMHLCIFTDHCTTGAGRTRNRLWYSFPSLLLIMMNETEPFLFNQPFPSANYISSIAKEIKRKHIHCAAAQQTFQDPKVRKCIVDEILVIIYNNRPVPSPSITIVQPKRWIQRQYGHHYKIICHHHNKMSSLIFIISIYIHCTQLWIDITCNSNLTSAVTTMIHPLFGPCFSIRYFPWQHITPILCVTILLIIAWIKLYHGTNLTQNSPLAL